MPGIDAAAVPPSAPVQAKPTPKNGTPPGAPQQPVPPVDVKPEVKPAAVDPRLAEMEKYTKAQARRAQELSTRQKEVETKSANLAKETAEFEEWKKLREDRRRNPGKYMEKDFGPKWYELMTKYQLEGAPTGDLIASEMDERQQQLTRQMDEREAKLNKRMDEMAAQDAARQNKQFETDTIAWVKQNAEKYPLIASFSEQAAVLTEIQRHFKATMKQAPDGTWERGEVLTAEEASAKVEARLAEIDEKFLAYRAAREAKAAPASTPPPSNTAVAALRNEAPHRRALSTAMTASSTPARSPPRDDREREKAAFAAWDAAKR